jgi:hypothetical protein
MPADLDGKPVLLILLSPTNTQRQYLLAGTGRWTGSAFEVQPQPPNPAVTVARVCVEQSSFEPEMLFNLVGAESQWPVAERLARGAARCIPALLEDDPPPGAQLTPGLIASMAIGPEGQLFLFQARQRKRAT